MDTLFLNPEKIKTSASHGLLINYSDKQNLKRSEKYVALPVRSIYYLSRYYPKNVIQKQ